MSAKKFFHLSEISSLLNSGRLHYETDGNPMMQVPMNPNTRVPEGQFAGIKPSDFLIVRGGRGCGHSISTVSESLVKMQRKVFFDQLISTENYRCWAEA
jgi:hypothetical protein